MTGTTRWSSPASASASQQSSTCDSRAISAIEQPAARSGSTTCCCGEVRMSADSAMKCTPQKTMYSAAGPGGRVAGELEGVAGDVGELDHLVALVVVTQHEHPVAERGLGGAGALDQRRVGGGGQVARALHPALCARVGPATERQQGQVDRRHAAIVGAPLSATAGGRRSHQRPVRDVRRGRPHVPQRHEPPRCELQPRREPDVDRPVFSGVRWPTARLPGSRRWPPTAAGPPYACRSRRAGPPRRRDRRSPARSGVSLTTAGTAASGPGGRRRARPRGCDGRGSP